MQGKDDYGYQHVKTIKPGGFNDYRDKPGYVTFIWDSHEYVYEVYPSQNPDDIARWFLSTFENMDRQDMYKSGAMYWIEPHAPEWHGDDHYFASS